MKDHTKLMIKITLHEIQSNYTYYEKKNLNKYMEVKY